MHYIGIDLGGTNLSAGIVNEKGDIILKDSVKTRIDMGYAVIVSDMAELIDNLCQKAKISIDDIKSVGIGSPGTVDSKNGVVVYNNNLNFENTPLKDELKKHLNIPIYVSNDANCAALGETVSGAAKGYKNVVMITLGTGVGGGIIIDGKIYEGDYSAGAELGHTLMAVDGEKCTCGRYGCWESYASATALKRQTKRAIEENKNTVMYEMIDKDLNNISGKTAFDAQRKGDKVAEKVIENYIKYVSEGVISVINIFRPEVLIIGGGVGNEGDNLLNPVIEYVKKFVYGGDRIPLPIICSAKLGNNAGIIGAAMLSR